MNDPRPPRRVSRLTDGWRFSPRTAPDDPMAVRAAEVTVPHTVTELPWHSFDDADYRMRSAYTRTVSVVDAGPGMRTFLRFEGVMTAAEVSLDGVVLAHHEGGFTPFEVELTTQLHHRSTVELRVDVDSGHLPHVPPFGGRVGFLTFGGIYREVTLEQRPAIHLADVVVRSTPAASARRDVEVLLEVAPPVPGEDPAQVSAARVALTDRDRVMAAASTPLTGTAAVVQFEGVRDLLRWDLDRPARYQVVVELLDGAGGVVDRDVVTTGFRDAAFTPEGFVLNGRRVQLRGLNRHQTYPYLGAAMPARMQRRDAQVLRRELGCNVVRSSHYPPSPAFLDACDELGLLVVEEIPGWQHLGEGAWRELVLRDVEAMVVRDRNHPSVILWGTRINESPDDHDLYARTAALAAGLDPTRPTGGIRNFPTSEQLEDVFTYNDFFWPLLDPVAAGQLNTEFVGHTLPTRQGDPSDRHVEQALRHARVHDHLASNPAYSGGIGWVAFDYHQGPELNSADRIDAHGVCDVFRHPKPAAAIYASQLDPAERIVLELVGSWARGDSAEPMGRDDPQVLDRLIASNCDRIEVFLDDRHVTSLLPDRASLPHLDHPPFRLPLPVERFTPEVLRLVGYRDDEPVIERHYAGDGVDRDLVVWLDHDELVADGNDLTQLSFVVTDQFGNRRRSATGVIGIDVVGGADVVGEAPFGLVAGGGAVYVRAGHEPGTASITVSHPRLGRREVRLVLRPSTNQES